MHKHAYGFWSSYVNVIMFCLCRQGHICSPCSHLKNLPPVNPYYTTARAVGL